MTTSDHYITNSSNAKEQFNRPKSLNSFGGSIIPSTIAALRFLNTHPDTIFTVLTGAGRFFSAGADVKGIAGSGVRFGFSD
jgi:peroxisomal 3,2-trans-enoyl-CoA isomerase